MEGKVQDYEGCGSEMRVNKRYVEFVQLTSFIFTTGSTSERNETLYFSKSLEGAKAHELEWNYKRLYKTLEQQDN